MKFWITIAVLVGAFVTATILSSTSTTEKKNGGTDFAQLIGKPAPDFTLKGLDGKPYTLSKWRGKKIVLFFNEGIMCYPACWNQIAALGTDKALNSGDVISASIVPDAASNWTNAIRKMPDLAKGITLLDTDNAVSRSYGTVSLASSMHKGVKPGHTYIIVDKKGIIRFTKDDPSMSNNNELLRKEVSKL